MRHKSLFANCWGALLCVWLQGDCVGCQIFESNRIVLLQDTHFDVYKGQFLEAATVEELNEWYQYFHMLLPKKEEEEPPEDGTMVQKRPKRASKYATHYRTVSTLLPPCCTVYSLTRYCTAPPDRVSNVSTSTWSSLYRLGFML